jgi:hypothetical protein
MILPYKLCTSGSIVSEGRFLLRYTNIGLQKNHPHKKEKLTTYYQNIKYSGMEISRGPVAQGP